MNKVPTLSTRAGEGQYTGQRRSADKRCGWCQVCCIHALQNHTTALLRVTCFVPGMKSTRPFDDIEKKKGGRGRGIPTVCTDVAALQISICYPATAIRGLPTTVGRPSNTVGCQSPSNTPPGIPNHVPLWNTQTYRPMCTCRANHTKQSIDPKRNPFGNTNLLGPNFCQAVGGKWCQGPRCGGTVPKSKTNQNSGPLGNAMTDKTTVGPHWRTNNPQMAGSLPTVVRFAPDRIARPSFKTGLGNNKR